MTTMREVAALAGVSVKTVSRVVNNDRYVSQTVRDRVEVAVAETGFVPNLNASNLRSGRSTAIGVAVPDVADPFFGTIIRVAEKTARGRGAALLVTSLSYDPAEERAAVESLLQRQIAGLIMAPTSHDQSYLRPWTTAVDMVFVDRPPRRLLADSFVEDDAGGAELATTTLLTAGHRRIAFLAPSYDVVTVARRLDGFRAALAAAGLDPDPDLQMFYEDIGVDTVAGCRQLLALPDPPTALFCGNLVAAIDVVPLLHRINRTDLALISFGDFPMAATLQPSVSVIDQQPDVLGQAAIDRLFRRIDQPGSRLKRHVILPVSVIDRDSSSIAGPFASAAALPLARA